MQIKKERILFRVGEDSFAVTLPKAWIAYKNLQHGDAVEIIVDEEITIRAKTTGRKDTEAKS